MHKDASSILKTYGLSVTQPRRQVLDVLLRSKQALSHKDIHSKSKIDLVTIYRILEKFEEMGIVHRHSRSGNITVCTLDAKNGHHVLMSCDSCGRVDECLDSTLCKRENDIAQHHGFVPKSHISEIVGCCISCS